MASSSHQKKVVIHVESSSGYDHTGRGSRKSAHGHGHSSRNEFDQKAQSTGNPRGGSRGGSHHGRGTSHRGHTHTPHTHKEHSSVEVHVMLDQATISGEEKPYKDREKQEQSHRGRGWGGHRGQYHKPYGGDRIAADRDQFTSSQNPFPETFKSHSPFCGTEPSKVKGQGRGRGYHNERDQERGRSESGRDDKGEGRGRGRSQISGRGRGQDRERRPEGGRDFREQDSGRGQYRGRGRGRGQSHHDGGKDNPGTTAPQIIVVNNYIVQESSKKGKSSNK